MPSKRPRLAQSGPVALPDPIVRSSCRFLRREFDYQLLHQINEENIGQWGAEDCREEIQRLFAWEVAKSDMGHAYALGDAYLHKAMEWNLKGKPQAHHERLAAIMKALWLRAKIQSSFFSVFMHLHRSGLVSLDGLEKPMNLGRIEDETVMHVYAALYNFEKLKEIGDDWRNTFPNHEALDGWFTPMAGYPTPLDWLATLIIRGALITDFRVILDKIEDFEEFGALDRPRLENYIEKYCPEVKELVRNPNANISYKDVEPRPRDVDGAAVAFWLPYDLGANVTAETAYRDFDDKLFIPLEDLFFRFFGLDKNSKLPSEMLPASMLQQSTGGAIKGKWNC